MIMRKNIYYFNVTYTCNSNCVFCYSHNTIHSGKPHKELDFNDFKEYLLREKLKSEDRVIINGGEPFLHTEIMNFLLWLKEFGCEVLIYTNGRLLRSFDFGFIDRNFRFVIPIHGYEELHDSITKVKGSYIETIKALDYLSQYDCLVDVKIILNNQMIGSECEFEKTKQSLEFLHFNNAVHITQMADTVVSLRNGCATISQKQSSDFTNRLFKYYKDKRTVKLFDTCIKSIEIENYSSLDFQLVVRCKDNSKEWPIDLFKEHKDCMKKCDNSIYCETAVGEYAVLEYRDNQFYKALE